jgi:hypothetical protein
MQMTKLLRSLRPADFPTIDLEDVRTGLQRTMLEEQLLSKTVFARKAGNWTAVKLHSGPPREQAVCAVPSIALGIPEPYQAMVQIMRTPELLSGNLLRTELRLEDERLLEYGWFGVGMAFDPGPGPVEFATGARISSWGTTPVHLLVPANIAAAWEEKLPWVTPDGLDWTAVPFRFVLRPAR